MKLLLIDDDATFARQLSAELHSETAGQGRMVHMLSADDGAELAARVQFSAILLSLTSSANGLDACRRLTCAAPQVPVLGIVAEPPPAPLRQQMTGVFADVIVKDDTTVAHVLQRVRSVVQRPQSRATHEAQPVPRPVRTRLSLGTVSTKPLAAANVDVGGGLAIGFRPEPPSEFLYGEQVKAGRPLRVLQVDGDEIYANLLQSSLSATMKVQCDVRRVGRLADALQCLVQQAYDVIVVEPSLPDSDGVETLATLRPYADQSPIVVVTRDEDKAQTLESLKHGAQDCHFKGQLSPEDLARSIRMAITRHQSAANFDRKRASKSLEKSRQAGADGKPSDRRAQPRYLLARPLIAIPIYGDGRPMASFPLEGLTMDVSAEGVGFEVNGLDRLPGQRLILGIEADSGELHFATIDVQWSVGSSRGLRLGGRLAPAERDLLCLPNLMPQFQPATRRFETGLPTAVLQQWAQIGICHPALVDRLIVCPDCRALPSFRHGCRACGSVRAECSQLIHHFPCAHVGLAADFQGDEGLVCPKCRQHNLVVGSDFEHLAGPYQCLDCHWTDTEFEYVGQCLVCDLRFPLSQAAHEDLIGYHVQRLDPLALVAGR
ncbi:MAG: response regulator [Pirellulaceae bacterium]